MIVAATRRNASLPFIILRVLPTAGDARIHEAKSDCSTIPKWQRRSTFTLHIVFRTFEIAVKTTLGLSHNKLSFSRASFSVFGTPNIER